MCNPKQLAPPIAFFHLAIDQARRHLPLAHARQPKDPALRPARDPHHCDLMRGGFQTVQGSVAPGSESSTAGLTAKSLDSLGMAMLAIPKKTHECVRQ